jgi:hypothetical protein
MVLLTRTFGQVICLPLPRSNPLTPDGSGISSASGGEHSPETIDEFQPPDNEGACRYEIFDYIGEAGGGGIGGHSGFGGATLYSGAMGIKASADNIGTPCSFEGAGPVSCGAFGSDNEAYTKCTGGCLMDLETTVTNKDTGEVVAEYLQVAAYGCNDGEKCGYVGSDYTFNCLDGFNCGMVTGMNEIIFNGSGNPIYNITLDKSFDTNQTPGPATPRLYVDPSRLQAIDSNALSQLRKFTISVFGITATLGPPKRTQPVASLSSGSVMVPKQ